MLERDHDSRGRARPRLTTRLAVLAVLVVVLPDCGGSTPTAPPTTTTTLAPAPPPPPAPTTLGDLSASLTSPQVDASLTCTDDVRVTIALTNKRLERTEVMEYAGVEGEYSVQELQDDRRRKGELGPKK